ncbi:hypothetical protein GFK97_19640 [Pseudomonas stutzeri]|jgi:hypothetical protein|uniref:hypothetical protein n=1 Tax=Stutzerimonas stutzeri TaxID=316 RepID=UPI0009B76B14|nr:hypothetical protein [Stutzerimonas stutzeri]MBK3882929.1 hypothetical protein [Stutzerimonas stutzeri]MCQ4290407.1 hypothetical protein [Stutzerimonas stutzeri]WOF79334.1 hypothetical protein P5704_002165 [Pseudomonas sp. FeN3W]
MSKRSLEELVTRSDISSLQPMVHWRRGRRNGQDRTGPNAAALIQRATHDIGILRTAAHS